MLENRRFVCLTSPGFPSSVPSRPSWVRENGRRLAGPSWEVYGHWSDDPTSFERISSTFFRKSRGPPCGPVGRLRVGEAR